LIINPEVSLSGGGLSPLQNGPYAQSPQQAQISGLKIANIFFMKG
jgi:hypothetical protein